MSLILGLLPACQQHFFVPPGPDAGKVDSFLNAHPIFTITMSAADELSDDDLQTVYCWVDSIQLSRPKRNISRDFADGGK